MGAVLRRNAMSVRTFENWTYLWRKNPVHAACPEFPIGHILENEAGEVVGTSTIFPIAYSLNGELVRAIVLGSWAVDPAYRSQSLPMAVKFLKLPADLILNTTASRDTSKLMQAFRLDRMPLEWFNEPLFWILDYRQFAAAALRKKGYSSAAGAGALAAGLGMYAADAIRGRLARSKTDTQGFTVEVASHFDERFDVFWEELRRTQDRLLRVRDAKSLSWTFGLSKHWILTAEKNGRLAGWLVLRTADNPRYGLKAIQAADLQTLDDDPACVRALAGRAIALGRELKAHMLEIAGFNRAKRSVLEDLGPYRRQLDHFPYFYKPRSELRAALSRPEAWDPSISDGD
jgi:hypothetical protein